MWQVAITGYSFVSRLNDMKQVRYHCSACDWTLLTDLWAADREEADNIPKHLYKRWNKIRNEHFETVHPERVAAIRLKRVLKATLV